MTDKGRPLPKFGEWDVNNPASAEGFTVIFSKARDEKNNNNNTNGGASSSQAQKNNNTNKAAADNSYSPAKEKRFCCF